jgi:hypothetical protein
MALVEQIQAILTQVFILPRRLSLLLPHVRATIPMLRGVWGAALHDLDPEAYGCVFMGEGSPHQRVPKFVLRAAPGSTEGLLLLEWILIGGLEYDASLLRAWDVASGMGLGRERRRFHIRDRQVLGPGGEPLPNDGRGWSLYQAVWPLDGAPQSTPCRLEFPAPLRLIRAHRLIEAPTLVDIAMGGLRRLEAFLPLAARSALMKLKPAIIEQAKAQRAEAWCGQRFNLVRYSGRQKRELELRGVSGHLDLPEGPGALWPLLAASQWLHLGKGTAVGMGQLVVAQMKNSDRLEDSSIPSVMSVRARRTAGEGRETERCPLPHSQVAGG